MSNYQNSKYNFFFPPKTVPAYNLTAYPNYEKEREKQKHLKKNNDASAETLKIFVDSHSSTVNERKAITQTYREINELTKTKVTGDVKEKKNVEKKQRKGTFVREQDKPEAKPFSEYNRKEKEKTERQSEKMTDTQHLQSVMFTRRFFEVEKKNSEKDKKIEKSEPGAFISAKLSRAGIRMEGKTSEIRKSSEVTMSATNTRKFQINQILKNHAQKFQMTPSRSSNKIKEYFLPGVSEEVSKTKSVSKSKHEIADEKKKESQTKAESDEPINKSKENGEVVVIKPFFKPTEENEPEQEKVKETVLSEEAEKEKKKVPDKWISAPLSNELERRLKSSGPKPQDLFPSNKEPKIEKKLEEESDEKKAKRVEPPADKVKEDDKRRTTYTDRLLVSRPVDKAVDKTVGSVDLKKVNENIMKTVQNVDYCYQIQSKVNMNEPPKEIILSKPTNLTPLKEDERTKETPDDIFKNKLTRSTELRVLVTQAVKDHKIFCIFDSHWYIVRPVREELLSRGWLEVIPDRRLIPRRRPPPTGPTYDREKSFLERNCNTIEAILAARENFADEIQETVSKCWSYKETLDKSKYFSMGAPVKKPSDESVIEALSQFQILPPTFEKKKNNFEIRDFVNKYKTFWKDKKGHAEEKVVQKTKDNKGSTTVVSREYKNGLPAIEPAEAEKTEPKAREKSSKSIYTESEAKTISKIIQSNNSRIHLMWLSIKPGIHLKCFNYSPEIINKFQKTTFCTKIGLWNHLNNIQWYAHEVHNPAKSPRMYNTGEADDLQAFFQDFQMTACLGLLKWLADTFFNRGIKAVQTKKGKVSFETVSIPNATVDGATFVSSSYPTYIKPVPLKAFEFAIKQCEKYIRFKDNEELNLVEEQKVLQEEWTTFLQWFYTITNDHGKVQECSTAQLMVVYTKAVETLKSMRRYWPEIDIDGRLNIWIMKPYCASCGRGIFMTNNVYYIGQHSKYIVQKYIERPLLIYNTKFDIRQWFMITKLTPLEIWMYKECYLRFCTQPFALRNLHESVHLSNNSVQRKYISYRDPGLPDQNMWDSNTFQMYLKTIGHPTAWQDIIYPGMKDAIVSIMLAAQDTFDGPRRSWFEVYGADFMLSANVKDGPWLIEINENPAMDPSTKVTARLCPQMLRDVIKVVVDKKANKNASTGQWELIYRQNYSPSFASVDLDVKGKKILRVPPVTKLGLNTHKEASNSNVRDYNDEVDAKFYDLVESYDKQSNKGIVNDYVSSLVEKFLGKEQMKMSEYINQAESYSSRERMVLNRETLMLVDQAQKNRQLEEKTKKRNFEPQTFGNVLESTESMISEMDSNDNEASKGDKNLLAVISSIHRKRLKRIRNCNSSTRESGKKLNVELGSKETIKSSVFYNNPIPATENRSAPPGLHQFNKETEVFNFTKFD